MSVELSSTALKLEQRVTPMRELTNKSTENVFIPF